jgi:hypothetical protein
LDKVLLIGTKTETAIGTPILESAKVYATVEEQAKSEKVIVFKKKRRKNYRRFKGHRQQITTLRILDICFDRYAVQALNSAKEEKTAQTTATTPKVEAATQTKTTPKQAQK